MISRLALAATLTIGVVATNAAAQALRSGVRISYTQINRQSGTQGSAFLPVSSSDVVVNEPTERACGGMGQRIRITARLPRGPIREVVLFFAGTPGTAATIDTTRCGHANVITTLEDGTRLVGGHGEVTVTDFGRPGEPARGRFSQTVEHDGVPTTIRGEFQVALPAVR